MSDGNEDVVRRANDAWNANDWTTMQSLFAPDASIRGPESWPESARFEGWPAIRAQLERLKEPWSDEHGDLVGVESEGDRVLTRTRWTGHGGESGLELDLELWNVYTVRGGRITEVLFHIDEDPARAEMVQP